MSTYSLTNIDWVIGPGQRPIIYLFLRDENKKKRILQIKNFLPYGYIPLINFQKLGLGIKLTTHRRNRMDNYKKLVDYEQLRLKFIDRDLSKTRGAYKIFFNNPYSIRDFRKSVEKAYDCDLYEADVSYPSRFPIRYLVDSNIKTGVDENGNPIDVESRFRILYLDLEARADTADPELKEEEIVIIGTYDNYTQKYIIFCQDHPKLYPGTAFDYEVRRYPGEKELLLAFVKYIRKIDPDVYIAYNLIRYDFPKLVYSLQKYGSELPDKFADKFYYTLRWRPRTLVKKRREWTARGKTLFDLLIYYRVYTNREFASYSLEYICNEVEKLKIPFIELKQSYKKQWDEDPNVLIKLNYWHTVAIKRLNEEREIFSYYDELRRSAGCKMEDTLSRKRIIDTHLLRHAHNKIILRRETIDIRIKYQDEGKLKGGTVINPIEGLHTNVIQVDLSSAYPRIIIAFNISFETLMKTGKIKVFDPSGTDLGNYSFTDEKKGIIPILIKSFLEKRGEKKELMSKEKDIMLKKMYNLQQKELKFTSNAMFGVMDLSSFRGYNKAASNAITLICRATIYYLRDQLKKMGITVIYGDTDSVFFILPDSTDIIKDATAIVNKLNKLLAADFEKNFNIKERAFFLELAKIYSIYRLTERKKKYSGEIIYKDGQMLSKPELEIKGWEIIRSDTSDFERDTLGKMMRYHLHGKDTEIVELWRKILKEWKTYGPMYVAYPSGYSKKINQYFLRWKDNRWNFKSAPTHVTALLFTELSRENGGLGVKIDRFAKPRRLPIDYKKLESLERHTKEYYKTRNISIYRAELSRFGKPETKIIELKKLKNIIIQKQMVIPDLFIKSIDWDRILDRLKKKIVRFIDPSLIEIEEESTIQQKLI